MFGGFDEDNSTKHEMNEINMVPLIDVMLVLLIIFMVTAPLLTHAVKINLPQASTEINEEKPKTVTLSVDENGRYFWNDERIEEFALDEKLKEIGNLAEKQPEFHLRADKDTHYQVLATILAKAHSSGVVKIGFITEPSDSNNKIE